jgi:hypothetical protein
VQFGTSLRAEARIGLVYGPNLTADSRCSISTARGGACTKLRRRYVRPLKQHRAGTRKPITDFTRKSRTRLQQTLCAIPKDQVIKGMLFITLTYPGVFPVNARVWKRDLDKFAKRFHRKYPPGAFVWKQEPQPKRHAPHYHLIVTGVRYIAKEWLSRAWYEVVGSGDPKHLVAGTQVQLVMSHRGVLSYAAKYTAKHQELPAEWQEPGRWWGVVNREALGIHWVWARLTDYQFWCAVRITRNLLVTRNRQRGRAPPRPCHSGMWAVLPDWQALRIAECALGTDRIGPPEERHERNAHHGSHADCRACSPGSGRSGSQGARAATAP